MAYVNVYGTLEEVESQLTYRLQVFKHRSHNDWISGVDGDGHRHREMYFVARWASLARPASKGLQRSSPLRTYLLYASMLFFHGPRND